MGYYIRILSRSAEAVHPAIVRDAASQFGARLSEDILPIAWKAIEIMNEQGVPLCVIERNSTDESAIASEEIAEFHEELARCLPESGAEWLASYLRTVRTIYAFQILDAVYEGHGWEVVGALKEAIWNAVGGIFQADGEGFSNEDGYHILWQFSDDVTGDWWVAVLVDGEWCAFQMDLGNEKHRRAFLRGAIPDGVAFTAS